MSTDKPLTYRGDIKSIAVAGDQILFCTTHPENNDGKFYRLSTTNDQLQQISLPCGIASMIVVDGTAFLSGVEGSLLKIEANETSIAALGSSFQKKLTCFARLSSNRIAAARQNELLIIEAATGNLLQTLETSTRITSVASNSQGEWIAAGQKDGTVAVFECEDKTEFELSAAEKLHQGTVTSILFEPEELRFFSAATDQKLFLTHARGKLESEDRGRGNCHVKDVTAMTLVQGDRFITGSKDKTCKSWLRAGATKPQTLQKEVVGVVAMATISIHDREHLVVACRDNSIRLFRLDAGKFGEPQTKYRDAYARIARQLKHKKTSVRDEGLTALAAYDDAKSVEALAKQIEQDNDHGLRTRSAELLAASKHPRSSKLLEPLLSHKDASVRNSAFSGLLARHEASDLRPIRLGLQSGKADVGVTAIEALGPLATNDDIARNELIAALGIDPLDVRQTALIQLETVFDPASPEADLIGLQSTQADVRKLGIVRFYQRGMLENLQVLAAIRRSFEDSDSAVRQAAFHVAVLARTNLATALRQADEVIHRHLFDIETFQLASAKQSAKQELPKVEPVTVQLSEEDYQPLISAMASRANDSCLQGAKSLAMLGDSRPFGLLLQLSRDDNAKVRIQVCQALAALKDPRALQRLETLIDDPDLGVRDAAYSSLAKISEQSDPLYVAGKGLSANSPEVRKRGLQTLVAYLRTYPSGTPNQSSLALLTQAINDVADAVRGEAMKAALNLQVGGDEASTLQFLLTSVQPDIRHDVLTEIIANEKRDWSWDLLVGMFNDPAGKIRMEAYEHALDRTKSKDLPTMRSALKSEYPNVRLAALSSLQKLATPEAHEIILEAIDDEDVKVRESALNTVINLGSPDTIRRAMHSKFAEVRMLAASARALFGDPQSKDPLLGLIQAPEPEKSRTESLKRWKTNVIGGLKGLSVLGDTDTFDSIMKFATHEDAQIRVQASVAIAATCSPDNIGELKSLLQHSDENLRSRAALGLAILGDNQGSSVLFSGKQNKEEQLISAIVLSDSEHQLVAMLDEETPVWRNAAFIVLMMRELSSDSPTPERCLAALSARAPRVRLSAGKALQAFYDATAFEEFIVTFVNDRGDQPAWTIPVASISTIANVMASGSTRTKVRAARLLKHLAVEKQNAWDLAWSVFAARHASELEQLNTAALQTRTIRIATATTISNDDLSQLAFGTYVGLVREQGGYHSANLLPAFGSSIVGVRSEAARRLLAMAVSNQPEIASAAKPVFVQALGDPLAPVRQLAFESLEKLGVSSEERAAAAIECGNNDLAVKGLLLLTENSDGAAAQSVLEHVVRTRSDSLAIEAAKLLRNSAGTIKASGIAMESLHSSLRTQAVGWLAAEYDAAEGSVTSSEAKEALRAATGSRYANVRYRAAIALADRKDQAAFDALVSILNVTSHQPGAAIVNAIVNLRHEKSSNVLIDRVKNDPEKTANLPELFVAAGKLRDASIVDPLMEMMSQKQWQTHAVSTIQTIAGYDQPIEDPNDDLPAREWLDRQHPRDHQLFASLIARMVELDLTKGLASMRQNVRWCLGNEVDSSLRLVCVNPDEGLRNQFIELAGWRVKHRGTSHDILIQALQHRDPKTKFLAAEGLAKAGREDGLSVLMSAVELMSDLSLRRRAVLALGELGNLGSLDLLLRLANDKEHALHDASLQAIGNLKNSAQRDKIFELLSDSVKKKSSDSREALIGLRFFDSPDGWTLIRQAAADEEFRYQSNAIRQLGYDKSAETRELIINMFDDDFENFDELVLAGRKSFDPDSLELDYAILKSGYDYSLETDQTDSNFHCVERVGKAGDTARILEILPSVEVEFFDPLVSVLLNRDPLPVDEAAQALESKNSKTLEVAARILGKGANERYAAPLGNAVTLALARWNKRRDKISAEEAEYDWELEEITDSLKRLCWAAGLCNSKSALSELLAANRNDSHFGVLRLAAINGLENCRLQSEDMQVIQDALQDPQASIRKAAANIIIHQDAARATELATELLSDRLLFNALAKAESVDVGGALKSGIKSANYQSIALPHLVAANDVETLSSVANDISQTDVVRLGAIEGLSRILEPAAAAELVSIGKNQNVDEELRKVAWRCLRRMKRQREKLQA